MGSDPYQARLNKASGNLLAELVKQDINWHTVKYIGQTVEKLADTALKEQVKQRQEYIRTKYEEKG